MNSERTLPKAFYRRPADQVAPELLGRYLICDRSPGPRALKIVEVEAYLGASDPASHAWNGRRTRRNEALYLAGGSIYVYFVYGMHHCFNVVTGREGEADAVLIRAGEPILGESLMRAARGLERPPRPGDIAGGPAKLCQALGIDLSDNGAELGEAGVRITAGEPAAPGDIASGARIGVGYAGEAASWQLRYAVRDHSHVSRPRL